MDILSYFLIVVVIEVGICGTCCFVCRERNMLAGSPAEVMAKKKRQNCCREQLLLAGVETQLLLTDQRPGHIRSQATRSLEQVAPLCGKLSSSYFRVKYDTEAAPLANMDCSLVIQFGLS